MKYRFGCPKCKGEDIAETNSVLARYDVTEWDEDGNPTDYDAGPVFWDTAEPIEWNPYQCLDCQNEFKTPLALGWIFDSIAERDKFIDEQFPQRTASDVPGLYSLPDGTQLGVNQLIVSHYQEVQSATETA